MADSNQDNQKISYSAVIIARNEEQYIKNALDSLLNQSVKPYKIIVVDDGSIDSTLDILRSRNVIIKRLPDHNEGGSRYSNTLSEVRNVGYGCVQNDPVDWIYSGDADIVLPPRYCETIMKQAEKNNAYIAAGTISKNPGDLPTDSCRMIRRSWLQNNGMITKWGYLYLSILALSQGKNTCVCHADDCMVSIQRPVGLTHKRDRKYNHGRMIRRMGLPIHYFLWTVIIMARSQGLTSSWWVFQGGFREKRQVSKEVSNAFTTLSREYFVYERLKYFKWKHRMRNRNSKNIVCYPYTRSNASIQ